MNVKSRAAEDGTSRRADAGIGMRGTRDALFRKRNARSSTTENMEARLRLQGTSRKTKDVFDTPKAVVTNMDRLFYHIESAFSNYYV